MEPTKTRKPAILIIVVSVVAASVAVLAFSVYKSMNALRLSQFVRSDLPMLDLDLRFITLSGEEVSPTDSRLVDTTAQGKQKDETPPSEECPELIGGDTSERTRASEKEERGKDCPKTATWKLKRHPVGFTLYVDNPAEVLQLFEGNSQAKEFFQSKIVQGLFINFFHSTGVRAEDLHLEGLQGSLLKQFLREALAAHAELHYDAVHGKKGFVFSFVRDDCPFVSKSLPIMVRVLARSGYRVAKLKEPILEMRVGLQRFFLAQMDDRIYLANGLEALLNVMDSLRTRGRKQPSTPLVLTARGEAFVDKLLPVMVGEPTWDLSLGLGLSDKAPGLLQFTAGKLTRQLRPRVFKGVFAGIPHDVFAAVVSSAYVSPDMTIQEWRRLATEGPTEGQNQGPEEAGFALLWDLDSESSQLTNMGVVIANQKTPDRVERFAQYFAHPELTAQCGGGTVFLAATSQTLLTRMKESCSAQSLSVLDWERGGRRPDYEGSQLFLFMNPAVGMRELSLAGGAKGGEETTEFDPEWKQQYEQAKEAMLADGEKVLSKLPIVAYAGSAVQSADVVQLKGFTVKQGASR